MLALGAVSCASHEPLEGSAHENPLIVFTAGDTFQETPIELYSINEDGSGLGNSPMTGP